MTPLGYTSKKMVSWRRTPRSTATRTELAKRPAHFSVNEHDVRWEKTQKTNLKKTAHISTQSLRWPSGGEYGRGASVGVGGRKGKGLPVLGLAPRYLDGDAAVGDAVEQPRRRVVGCGAYGGVEGHQQRRREVERQARDDELVQHVKGALPLGELHRRERRLGRLELCGWHERALREELGDLLLVELD